MAWSIDASTVVMVWPWVVMVVMLVIASITDVRSGKIYNGVTYPAIALGLVGHTVLGGLTGAPEAPMGPLGLTGSALGFAVGFGPMLLAWLAGGVNGGDAKLMGAVGALGGVWFAVEALFYGLIAAAVAALVMMIIRGTLLATLARIGRFLYMTALTGRRADDPTRPDSPRIPLGVTFSIGALVALVEFIVREGNLIWDLQ